MVCGTGRGEGNTRGGIALAPLGPHIHYRHRLEIVIVVVLGHFLLGILHCITA